MRGKENGFCPSRVHLVSRKKWTLKNAACVKSFKENSVYYGGDSTSLLTAFEVTVMYILHICSAVTELLKCLSLVLFNRRHIAKRPADMRSTKSSGHKKDPFLFVFVLLLCPCFTFQCHRIASWSNLKSRTSILKHLCLNYYYFLILL